MSNTFGILMDMIKGEDVFDNISREFKIAVISTFTIGLAAHMFIFTNPIFEHDAIHMYWPKVGFVEAAAGGRWLVPFWQGLLDNVFQPWLCGVITLIFYSIASYLICRCFDIKHSLSIILICGLMITSPTAISANLYLSSSYIYAVALLLSVLAVYYYKKAKYGWFVAFVAMFLCGSTYTAYISFGVSLFIFSSIVKIIKGECNNFKKTLLSQIGFCFVTVVSLLVNVVILTTWGQQESIRGVELSANKSLIANVGQYIFSALRTYKRTIDYFSPLNNLSYFQNEKILYTLFVFAMISAAIVCVWVAKKYGIYKKTVMGILMVDVLILPLAMDILGMLYESHLLMQAAFILPWVFCVVVYETICNERHDILQSKKICLRKIRWITYASLIVICSIYTIGNRVELSNVAYTKAYANYEAGISHANRIVAKIESVDGYVPGETKVIFVGSLSGNDHKGAFNVVGDLTGIGSNFLNGYWDSAMPGIFALKILINQQLAVDMDIIGPDNNNYVSYMDAEMVENILSEMNASFENIAEDINRLSAYSAENCYILKEGILIYKLS